MCESKVSLSSSHVVNLMIFKPSTQKSACGGKMKLTAQTWNSSPEDSSVKNMASGAKTPKIGGKSSIRSKLSTGQLKNTAD